MDNSIRLQEKKDKVMSNQPRVSSTSILIILIVATMIGGGIFLARSNAKDVPPPPKKVARVSVSGPINYSVKRYDMSTIDIEEDEENIIIPLKAVKKNRIVSFKVKSGGVVVQERNFGKRALPLLAYLTPAGNLVTAISYCEPCRSIYFHTESDLTLTCHVCGTKWDLESLEALSGACMPYPPAEVKAKVVNGKIYLKKSEINSWKPRVEV